MNKRKLFNDPVYGFITIPYEIIFDIIEHKWFQRLRRIQQLGLSNLVYPGAHHTRFHHALGAMHLMGKAIHTLRSKGHTISQEEAEAVTIAILLHDIGHGPFSHALENTIVNSIHHEELSRLFMVKLNEAFEGKLSMAIQIFNGAYHKKFLSHLVSSQLDVDRLDYLTRDSYFTGVHEGVIGYDRLIEMMDVVNDELVIEQKGIYSVEKFIIARRVMYWQVYLHKTVLAAEQMLIKVLQRAKQLVADGIQLYAPEALHFFLQHNVTQSDFITNPELLDIYARLDDNDIYGALKQWQFCDDFVLAYLCKAIIERKLFKIEMENSPIKEERIMDILAKVQSKLPGVNITDMHYFVFNDTTSNSAYVLESKSIKIKLRNGQVLDVVNASDHLNLAALTDTVVKHYLCYPKEMA